MFVLGFRYRQWRKGKEVKGVKGSALSNSGWYCYSNVICLDFGSRWGSSGMTASGIFF